MLIGAALHAADRLRRGHAATDLERELLQALRAAMTDAEIKEFGRVYRESVDKLGRLDAVPEVITSRAVSSGYSVADLKADFPAMAQECMARANMSVVDSEVLAAGGTVDSPSFTSATREAGFGATAARMTPAGQAQPSPAPTYPVKLELESFYVERAVGDGFTGGKDEIYWCVTASSDKWKAPVFRSEEFGSVKKGETRSFSSSKRVVFDGQASKGLAMHIMVWEADQSTSQWYDKLQKAMQTLCDRLFNTWQWQVGGAIGDAGLVGGFMMNMVEFAATFITLFRNEDDLSCERGLVLDQQTLAVMTHRGTTDWHFNGDGHHTLKVKSTGPKVPFPTGTLEYAVRTGSSWGKPIALPWQSMTPPALASYNGKLYAAYVRPDQAVMWTRLENGQWRAPERIGGDQSYFAPALGVAHGKLFYAVTGRDGGLNTRTFNGTTWSAIYNWKGYGSAKAPSMATHRTQLWLTHIGADGTIHHNTHDGKGWHGPYQDNLEWTVNHPVTTASWGDNLWRIARGTEGKFYTSSLHTGADWTDRGLIGNWTTPSGPAIAAHDGKLWIFFRDGNSFLRAASRSASTWTDMHHVSGTDAIKLMDEPAAASHNNKLYVMYRR
ncbi:hypothetical protein [Streptomyces sp. NPDC058279]|uniref:hypothetical protein n=1 Tax=Streptomyces sp. NPDC058279 TaxID=3346418 RepID=UPI0036E802BC